MYTVAGSNLFGQWTLEESLFTKFREIPQGNNNNNFNLNRAMLITINWSNNIFVFNNQFYVSGSWRGEDNRVNAIDLPADCASFNICSDLIISSNDYKLILVEKKSHNIWIIDIEQDSIKKIKLDIENPLNEDSINRMRKDNIIKVVATNHSIFYLTEKGMLYDGFLPSYVDTTHCIGSVCDIECGYEHFILLTDAGRVYTWGNGRRLQLGHGDIDNLDSPTELEALAGIRIIKIKAGGWHSLALSESGDLYAWGWNDAGQLGIKEKDEPNALKKSHPLPTVVDIFDGNREVMLNVKDITCGTRHSAIVLDDNTVWTTGFNKYGQLGFCPETYPTINHFKKSFKCKTESLLMCGPWSTVLIKKI